MVGKQEASVELKKQLQSTQSVLVEDKSAFQDTSVGCKEKRLSLGEKQTLHAEEIEANAYEFQSGGI
eukprot:9650046-Heterocapsa_arctica.AAC.1